MEHDHLPSPQRFQVFTELPNGKGFRIKDSKYIYMFDKYGGWFDEYNNYYNADGQPQQPPSDEDDDFQRVILDEDFEDGEDYDQFDKEYGAPGHNDYDDDHYHHEHQKTLEAIAHNQSILHEYPLKTALRVDFQNMSFKATKQQVLKHYRSKIGNGILNVILTQTNGKFNGEGYFVCKQVSVAEKLIKYEGEEFLGRKVNFDVQPVHECFAYPVTKEEMDVFVNEEEFDSLIKEKPKVEEPKEDTKGQKKKYFAKTSTEQKKEQTKQTAALQKAPKQLPKQQTKVQPAPQKEEKKEPTWSKYQGDMTMFPKKISFMEWMTSRGFNQNEHFKNLTKIDSKDSNKRLATVELRSDVYQKINGLLYQSQKVTFQKVN